jgi:hypothetical protein
MLENPVTFPSPLKGYSSGRVSKGWDTCGPPPTRLGIICEDSWAVTIIGNEWAIN